MKKFSKILGFVLVICCCVIAFFYFSDYKNIDDFKTYCSTKSNSSTKSKVVDVESRYWYGKLSKKQKIAYDNIYNEICSFPKKIEVPKLSADEIQVVYEAISYDNPELFFLSKQNSIVFTRFKTYFEPQYIMSKADYENSIKEINGIANSIKTKVNNKSDYETELYVHDYLAKKCIYFDGQSPLKYTIYGALVKGQANCEGYARSMQYLLEKLGVQCRVIVGTATNSNEKTEGHMWNVVTIDSKDYNLDTTWDDYMVAGSDIANNDCSHMYFNVPTIDICSTHKSEPSLDNKNCIYDDASYFKCSNLFVKSYNNASKTQLTEAIANSLNEGRRSVEIKFGSQQAYNDALSHLIKKQYIYRIISRANLKTNNKVSDKNLKYLQVDDKLVLRLFFI